MLKLKHILRIIWTFSRSWGNILDHPDTLHINRTLFILSGHFLDHPDSGHFPNHPDGQDTFQVIQTDHTDTLQIIWTLFISSRHFSDYSDTLQIRILWLCPVPMTISWLDPSEPTWPWSLHECRDATLSKCTGAIEHCFIHPGSCWWISPSSHLKNIVKKIPTQIQNTKIQKYSKSPRLGQGGWSDPGIREWG